MSCYSFAVRTTSSRSDRASKSGCPRRKRLGLGQRAQTLESGTPGFEFRVLHFLVVGQGARKVSNWFLWRSPSLSARRENEYLSLELAGEVKGLIWTRCLAHNTHQAPRFMLLVAHLVITVSNRTKRRVDDLLRPWEWEGFSRRLC